MLGRWTRDFRRFLLALEAHKCPFCTFVIELEGDMLRNLRPRLGGSKPIALCGRHLHFALKLLSERRAHTELARSVLAVHQDRNQVAGWQSCQVCEALQTRLNALAATVRRLDDRMRFEKALKQAPLFCRPHIACVLNDGSVPNFLRIQSEKVKELNDQILQAFYRHKDVLGQLIEQAVAYAGRSDGLAGHPNTVRKAERREIEAHKPDAENAELERWDNEQMLKHISDLETEVAKLRYLVDENRRLKLARGAVEAMRRDLQCEREALSRDQAEHVEMEPGSRATEKR